MAEKEYIEREAALNAIKDEIENYRPNPDPYSITPYEFVRRGLNIAYSIIKNQPTADVQEVRHGKNITKIKPVDEFECSECGFICEICENIYYDDCICHREYNPEFCPNCGAKMNKE